MFRLWPPVERQRQQRRSTKLAAEDTVAALSILGDSNPVVLGPPRREHMYTRDWLERTFSGWEILVLEDYDAVIREGQAHNGMSALIDLVARKS